MLSTRISCYSIGQTQSQSERIETIILVNGTQNGAEKAILISYTSDL